MPNTSLFYAEIVYQLPTLSLFYAEIVYQLPTLQLILMQHKWHKKKSFRGVKSKNFFSFVPYAAENKLECLSLTMLKDWTSYSVPFYGQAPG
jgi:hypothetical protein